MNLQLSSFFLVFLLSTLLFALCLLLMQLSRLAAYFIPLKINKFQPDSPRLLLPIIKGVNREDKSASTDEVERLRLMVKELENAKKEQEEQKNRLEEVLLHVEKDNYRKTAELLEAQELQLSMLPRHTPFYPGYEIAFCSEPASEVGGDYYDYSFTNDYKNLYLVLGDATGHGYKPSVLVATAKSYFQTQAGKVENEVLLQQISEAINSLNVRGLYMALTLLKIDGDLITIVSSGMPPVYYYQAKTSEVQECRMQGMFLGVRPKVKINKKVFRMHRGDALLFMTDGLAEAQNSHGELLGFEALKAKIEEFAVYSSKELITELIREGTCWKGDGDWKDDMSLIAIKKK
jgi:serine phosphatase RsbU (regulator of sigma subunit)